MVRTAVMEHTVDFQSARYLDMPEMRPWPPRTLNRRFLPCLHALRDEGMRTVPGAGFGHPQWNKISRQFTQIRYTGGNPIRLLQLMAPQQAFHSRKHMSPSHHTSNRSCRVCTRSAQVCAYSRQLLDHNKSKRLQGARHRALAA